MYVRKEKNFIFFYKNEGGKIAEAEQKEYFETIEGNNRVSVIGLET